MDLDPLFVMDLGPIFKKGNKNIFLLNIFELAMQTCDTLNNENRSVFRIRIRDPVLFGPLDPGFGMGEK
jgi:hypothetical protein